jgi:hypothetical protein
VRGRGEWLTSARVPAVSGEVAARDSTSAMLRRSSVAMETRTRCRGARRTRLLDRRGLSLPGEREGSGRRSSGDGELQERMIDLIPCELGQAEASGDAPELQEEDEARGRSRGRLTSSKSMMFIIGDCELRW